MINRTDRQKEGIKKWVDSGCKASWTWATGVGKTFGAIMAIKMFLSKNKDKIIVVVVPTEYLKVQWLQELSKNGIFNFVTVEIINSAVKKDNQIDFIILDECHKYASTVFFEIFSKRKPKVVLGLSATFDRLDGRHQLLNHYCPVCDTITSQEAIANKWLSPYVEYKVLIEPDDIEIYNKASRQFHESFSVFGFDFNLAMSCMTNIIARRTYAKKIGISSKEMDAVTFTWGRSLRERKSFIMNHPKKIEIARKILNSRKNKKAITFSATIKQAERIGIGLIVHSGKTKKKNHMTMEEFAQLECGVINSSKSLIEGVDIPGLNLAIILCGDSSAQAKVQKVGRIIRYEKEKECEVFNLVLRGTVEENWFSNSTAGRSFIEITESELDNILSGKLSENVVQEGKVIDNIFRY